MKLLDGTLTPDAGEVVRQTGVTVARLEQEVPDDVDGTMFDVVAEGLGAAGAAPRALPRTRAIASRPITPTPRCASSTGCTMRSMPPTPGRCRRASRPCSSTSASIPTRRSHARSGGRKRQALLARALVRQPDVLLLDEPTNHLDVEAIEWMERFLIDRGIDAALRHARPRVPAPRRDAHRRARSRPARRLGRGLRHVPRAQGSGARRRGEGVGGVRQEAGEGGGVDPHRHPGAPHAQRGPRARARGAARGARRAARAHRHRAAARRRRPSARDGSSSRRAT